MVYATDHFSCSHPNNLSTEYLSRALFLEIFNLTKKIYVGNLSFQATEQQVSEMFSEFGAVESIAYITDRDSGRFRGFCFVEMEDAAAMNAINALNGKDIDNRELRVNEAQPRNDRSQGGGNNRRNNNNNRRW